MTRQPPSETESSDAAFEPTSDSLAPARGLSLGLLISLVLWILLIAGVGWGLIIGKACDWW